MALGNTNITTTLVRSILSEAINKVFGLCTSANINKWSKYKPVTGTWPAGTSGKYALNLPTNWDIVPITSAGRLGDFRGYEHSKLLAFPSIQCRDTDNDFEINLYPSGSTYMQRWYCRAYRSASDVVIIPSDLGLDSYYVGLKVAFGGATWYKTFGQVSDLVFTKTWNASISVEIVTWSGTPAYSNFPYGTGVADWELILCSTAATSWTNGAPSDIINFPTGTDGADLWITSGAFTVKDWLKLSDNDLVFNASASYQEVVVYCSTANLPAFTIADDSAWITIAVYDEGTLISNPALYAPGMDLRVSVSELLTYCTVSPAVGVGEDWTLNPTYTSGSATPGAIRDGTVTVTSELEESVISVSQGVTGSDQLTFGFRSVDLGAGDTAIDVVIKRGETTVFSDTTGTYLGRDGYTKSYTVTLSEVAVDGVTYDVILTRHV